MGEDNREEFLEELKGQGEPRIPAGVIGGAALLDALRGARGQGPGSLGAFLASGVLPPVLAALLAKKLVSSLYRGEEGEKRASPLLAMVRMHHLKQAATLPKPQGALKNSLSVAYNNTPPKPQTTPVGGPRKVMADPTGVKATPPSKKRFFNDQSKANLGFTGSRQSVPSTGQ